MLAAQFGHEDVVFFLTKKGANLDLVNEVSAIFFMLLYILMQFICYIAGDVM